MATDWVDGWLARRSGSSSAMGSLLDPVADKILVLSVLIVLLGEGVFAGGAIDESIAWWALLVALVVTWVSGLDYARLAPRLLRGRAPA